MPIRHGARLIGPLAWDRYVPNYRPCGDGADVDLQVLKWSREMSKCRELNESSPHEIAHYITFTLGFSSELDFGSNPRNFGQ